jgi:hypothetical protein
MAAGTPTKLGLSVDDVRAQGAPFPEASVQLGSAGLGLSHRARHPVAQCLERRFAGFSRAEMFAQAVERERLRVKEEFFLGGEMHGHGSGRDVGAFGDVADGGLAVAALSKQLQGGRLDRLPGASLSSLLPVGLLCSHRRYPT